MVSNGGSMVLGGLSHAQREAWHGTSQSQNDTYPHDKGLTLISWLTENLITSVIFGQRDHFV